MMAVARYWESICNKRKILFPVLAKKTQSTFILDNGTNYKMKDSPNEKKMYPCLKNQTENTIFRWGIKPLSYHCTLLFKRFPVLISNNPAKCLAKVLLGVFSIMSNIWNKRTAEIFMAKNSISLETMSFFDGFRGTG